MNRVSLPRCIGVLAIALAGCGGVTRVNGDAAVGAEDLSVAVVDLRPGVDLASPCGVCPPATPVCDVKSGKCVACQADGDCPDQFVCARDGSCVPGCSPTHASCGDAGSCDVDMGRCHGCLSDKDCPAAPNRVCDLPSGRCVACSLQNDQCADGSYCAQSGGGLACVPGCKGDFECKVKGASFACCAHACVDTLGDKANCGGCGFACGNGSCCAGACANVTNDVKNCGGCGKSCAAPNGVPVCAAGVCGLGACAMGFSDCDQMPANGCEVSIGSDTRNCGQCGLVCALAHAAPGCIGGKCAILSCDLGFRDCDQNTQTGCEVDAQNDPKNCGACGSNCANLPNAVAGCAKGGCVIAQCSPGFGNCNGMDGDGCEATLGTDPLNCGGCGKACPAAPNVVPSCVGGVCGAGVCAPGFADCNGNLADGCEVKLATDVKSCGKCGNACPVPANASAGCAAGVCGIGACSAGFGDCNNNPADGCETSLNTDVRSCGKCGNVCPVNTPMCVAGVCKAGQQTIDTHNFMGYTEYPLDLDKCLCCGGTTSKQEADQFCILAGLTSAVSWTTGNIVGTNCYCWGNCSGNKWISNCCGGQASRPMILTVTCQ